MQSQDIIIPFTTKLSLINQFNKLCNFIILHHDSLLIYIFNLTQFAKKDV